MDKHIKPLVGWRVFRLLQPHYLIDLGTRMVFEPRKEARAFCPSHEDHYAPEKDCTCGLWSFRSKEELMRQNYGNSPGLVLGEFYIWGKIQVSENCFRSEFGYVKKLYFEKNIPSAGWIAEVYGVPYEIDSSWARYPNERAQPLAPPKAASTYLTEEELWALVEHQNIPLELRRSARTQLNVRLGQRLKNALAQKIKIERALDWKKREISTLIKQRAYLQTVKEELHKGGQ